MTYGANKDAPDQHDQTPLLLAAREGHLEAALALLERGASKDMVDDVDRSPLQVALERGHDQLALVLARWQQRSAANVAAAAAMTSGGNAGVGPRVQQGATAAAMFGGNGETATLGRRAAKPKPPKRTKSLREKSANNATSETVGSKGRSGKKTDMSECIFCCIRKIQRAL